MSSHELITVGAAIEIDGHIGLDAVSIGRVTEEAYFLVYSVQSDPLGQLELIRLAMRVQLSPISGLGKDVPITACSTVKLSHLQNVLSLPGKINTLEQRNCEL